MVVVAPSSEAAMIVHNSESDASVMTKSPPETTARSYVKSEVACITVPESVMVVVNQHNLPILHRKDDVDDDLSDDETQEAYRKETKTSVTTQQSRREADAETASTSVTTTPQLQKKVSFDSIHVRQYSREMGDHPGCRFGVPITLSWEFSQDDAIDIDVYEAQKNPNRRHPRHFMLSASHRRWIMQFAGYTEEDMESVEKSIGKIQRQRCITKLALPLCKAEEAWQSAGRKINRFLDKRKQQKEQRREERAAEC